MLKPSPHEPDDGFLDGHFLIAMPGMEDQRFASTVVFLCAHSPDGAMGLTINQPVPEVTFQDLLSQLEIVPEDDAIHVPEAAKRIQINRGGPVETGRGFVLHSADYFSDNATLPIDDHISLTASLDILRDIARGAGPQEAMLALGYAGWAPGQLEQEIQANGWLHCPARADLIFDAEAADKYKRALALLGVDVSRLSGTAGHA